AARDRARHRLRETPWATWGDVPGPAVRRLWPVASSVLGPVRLAIGKRGLSTRGIDRVLKVAWTLADLAGHEEPGPAEVMEALWVRGQHSLGEVTSRAVSVVGTRTATDYGLQVAADLAYGLAESGWTVVSGLAYGIDAQAHRGALAAGGITVAVLACGVDVSY